MCRIQAPSESAGPCPRLAQRNDRAGVVAGMTHDNSKACASCGEAECISPLVIYCQDCIDDMADRYRCCFDANVPCRLDGVCN
jgi:hypothetical protein